jgi:hypothetical protein
LEKEPSLFGKDGIKPYGVIQGRLGDCWFLAAASAIAEYPERISKIMVNEDFTASGIMQFHMWSKGERKTINIDDLIPVDAHGKPVLAKQSKNGAWWVPIFEKAMAKFNVNYIQMDGGNPSVAFK